MGKGTILSGGTNGRYQVTINYGTGNLDAWLDRLDTAIGYCDNKIDEYQEYIDDFDDEFNAFRNELLSLEADIKILKDAIDALIDDIADLQEDISDENDLITFYNLQIDNMEDLIDGYEDDKDDLDAQIAALQILLDADPGNPVLIAQMADLVDQRDAVILNITNTQNAITGIEASIVTSEDNITGWMDDISGKNSEISEKRSEKSEKEAERDSTLAEQTALSNQRTIIQGKLDAVTIRKLSYEKRKYYLESNTPEDRPIDAWCADLTEDLTGVVGLIEIPGESGAFNIQPGHENNAVYSRPRDGQLVPLPMQSPAQVFYNLAMLPGWQKWMPTYRYGTITDIDAEADTADVALDAAISSQQSLNINQSGTLTAVPVEYMTCNAGAFEIGDSVLVQFVGQDFSAPKIIGFKDNPKSCTSVVLLIRLGVFCAVYNMVDDEISTDIPKDGGGVAQFPCPYSDISHWAAEQTEYSTSIIYLSTNTSTNEAGSLWDISTEGCGGCVDPDLPGPCCICGEGSAYSSNNSIASIVGNKTYIAPSNYSSIIDYALTKSYQYLGQASRVPKIFVVTSRHGSKSLSCSCNTLVTASGVRASTTSAYCDEVGGTATWDEENSVKSVYTFLDPFNSANDCVVNTLMESSFNKKYNATWYGPAPDYEVIRTQEEEVISMSFTESVISSVEYDAGGIVGDLDFPFCVVFSVKRISAQRFGSDGAAYKQYEYDFKNNNVPMSDGIYNPLSMGGGCGGGTRDNHFMTGSETLVYPLTSDFFMENIEAAPLLISAYSKNTEEQDPINSNPFIMDPNNKIKAVMEELLALTEESSFPDFIIKFVKG